MTTRHELLESSRWEGRLFGGAWGEPGGGTAEVVEPATGASLGAVGLAGVEDVTRAAAAADDARAQWAARSPQERAAILRRAGLLFEGHAEEIGRWIVAESGAIGPKAGLETHVAAQECFEASALATTPSGELLATEEAARWSFARRRPVGVVSVIAPFNFPLILSIRAVAPALALGNAVLLKPDPRTAVSGGVVLARVFEEAGLPPGLLHVLPGGGDIGEACVVDPRVGVVAFTGSTNAGRAVGRLAGEHLKKASLELGGNNALIVLPGADVERAASAAAFGSFMHQGQICMTAGRHLVHASLAEEFVAALAERARRLPVGDPAREEVALGPIIDGGQFDRVRSLVDDAVAAGARLVAGGPGEGTFFSPTVLADVAPDNPAWTREIFGPVAPVATFSTTDEAVALADDSEYGLSVGILGDVGEAMRIADRLASGKVHINEQTVLDEATAPFGGFKDSGNGTRIGGPSANLDLFTETQWLTARPDIAGYPF